MRALALFFTFLCFSCQNQSNTQAELPVYTQEIDSLPEALSQYYFVTITAVIPKTRTIKEQYEMPRIQPYRDTITFSSDIARSEGIIDEEMNYMLLDEFEKQLDESKFKDLQRLYVSSMSLSTYTEADTVFQYRIEVLDRSIIKFDKYSDISKAKQYFKN